MFVACKSTPPTMSIAMFQGPAVQDKLQFHIPEVPLHALKFHILEPNCL